MRGPAESEVRPDTDAAEDFAAEVGPDPTQDEIEHYRRLEGEPSTEDESGAMDEVADDVTDPAVN